MSCIFSPKIIARNWGCSLSAGTFEKGVVNVNANVRRIWSNAWLLSFECSAHILVVIQKSMEKLLYVEWRNSCQQIPEKDQSYVKVGRNNVCYVEVLKLWVRLWSIFHCNFNSKVTFDEQGMKKTSWDSTLNFFWFRSKIFFPKFELLN